MLQKIVTFDKDELGDWIAILSCGHSRHVRHNPPWFNRPWVEHEESRNFYLGYVMDCRKCEQNISK